MIDEGTNVSLLYQNRPLLASATNKKTGCPLKATGTPQLRLAPYVHLDFYRVTERASRPGSIKGTGMFGLKETATQLGISEKGLRTLIKRRAIRYYQPHNHCPIKFRQEWIDEYRRRWPAAEPKPKAVKVRAVAAQDARRPFLSIRGNRVRPEFKDFRQLVKLVTPQYAAKLIEQFRWPPRGKVRCQCGSTKIKSDRVGNYSCRRCGTDFSLLDGTAAAGSPVRIDAWLVAVWCLSPGGKDLIGPSLFARAMGLSEPTARRILKTIRGVAAAFANHRVRG